MPFRSSSWDSDFDFEPIAQRSSDFGRFSVFDSVCIAAYDYCFVN
jgi:hypothetical protein